MEDNMEHFDMEMMMEMMDRGRGRGMSIPDPLPQLKDPEITIDDTYIATKEWERKYNKWLMQGAEKPGKHPNPDHDWNNHPEKFYQEDEEMEEANKDAEDNY